MMPPSDGKFRANTSNTSRAALGVVGALLHTLVLACSSDDERPPPAGSLGGRTSLELEPLRPAPGAGGAGGAGGLSGAGGMRAGGAGSEGGLPVDLPNVAGNGGAAPGPDAAIAPDAGPPLVADAGVIGDTLDDGTMTFFVTSRGVPTGANLGGLAGADAFCSELASAASPTFSRRTWRAYLSTTAVNARDRIGNGPWRNQAGNIVASDVEALHDQDPAGALGGTWPVNDTSIALDELGAQVPQNVFDVLTGSQQDGTLALDAGGTPLTCADWTSADGGFAQSGHSNRSGFPGQPSSWNSVHTVGCAPAPGGQNLVPGTVSSGGGRGSLYCFALITGS